VDSHVLFIKQQGGLSQGKQISRENKDMSESMVLVSGLPRSGTSMIMQMLEAGGVEILSDGVRSADDDNPRGYYELEAVKKTKDDASWLEAAQGKAVKLISQLLYDLPDNVHGKVIFMRREMGETLASQRKMLERRGESVSAEGDTEMARIFEAHVADILAWGEARDGLEVLEVWHGDVLQDPRKVAERMNGFLGMELDTVAMAQAVDKELHRNRMKPVSS
jgi:hypothetical protein